MLQVLLGIGNTEIARAIIHIQDWRSNLQVHMSYWEGKYFVQDIGKGFTDIFWQSNRSECRLAHALSWKNSMDEKKGIATTAVKPLEETVVLCLQESALLSQII